jgi:hypothetical protein
MLLIEELSVAIPECFSLAELHANKTSKQKHSGMSLECNIISVFKKFIP